jgi:hypothetical protein
LRPVRHVEDREDRALSILNKLIEGFRLEDMLDRSTASITPPLRKTSLPASVSTTALSIIRMTTSRQLGQRVNGNRKLTP